MSPADEKPVGDRPQRTFRLTLAAVIGQVGCLTSIILLAALFGGIWLDGYLNTKPIFTIGLIVLSVPVTVVAMVWIVQKTTANLQSKNDRNSTPQNLEGDISG